MHSHPQNVNNLPLASNPTKYKVEWKILSRHEKFHRFHFAISAKKGEFIIIAGGYGKNGVRLKSVVMFDIQRYKMTSLPDLPDDFCKDHSCCKGALLKNYFYVVGNFGSMVRLNLKTKNGWEFVSDNQICIQSIDSVISYKSYLLIIGDSGRYNIFYEPESNRYINLPRIIAPRYGAAFVNVGDDVYAIGGFHWNKLENLSSVEIFNLCSRRWRSTCALPLPLRNASAVHVDKWIVVNGGHDIRNKKSLSNFVFNLKTKKWTQNNKMLSMSRTLHECVTFSSGEIASIGGLMGKQNKFCSFETMHRKFIIPNWEVIGPYILLRELVNFDRASFKSRSNEVSDERNIFQNVMERLMADLNLDVFRLILSFLV